MGIRERARRKNWRSRGVVAITAATITAAVASTALLIDGALAVSRSKPVGSLAVNSRRASLAERSSGIPAGWDPVPYRRAQLSVPGRWLVETPRELFCEPRSPGMIFSGARPGIPKTTGCGLTARYAWILPAGHIPQRIRHRKPTAVIHGFRVYQRPSGPNSVLYLVPELGVRVGAHGPLRMRVLATLNRSPLSVALGKGKASPVPARWARHHFGGVSFAAPRTWHRHSQTQWATCGTGVVPRSLVLIDAIKPPLALPCPFPLPDAAALAAQPGLTAVTGKFAARSVGQQFTRCQLRHRTRICLAAVTGHGGLLSGVLIFSVGRPHHHPAAFFLLGLSGSGDRSRTIFDSMTLR
jgi:hypothetical protein